MSMQCDGCQEAGGHAGRGGLGEASHSTGAHLASVPDPDKSEEDFKQYTRAKGTTAEDFVAMQKRLSAAQIKAKKVAGDLKVSFACLSSDDPAKGTKLSEQAEIYSGFVDGTVACITALTFLRNPEIRQATGTELRSFLRQVIVCVQKKKESSSAAVPSRLIDEGMLLLDAFDDSKTAAVATEESCATGSGDVAARVSKRRKRGASTPKA